MAESFRAVEAIQPEDIAGLTPEELADLVAPAAFSMDDLRYTLGEAKSHLARFNLSKRQRGNLLPQRRAAETTTEQVTEEAWLLRAAKTPCRRRATGRAKQQDAVGLEKSKANKAAARSCTGLQKEQNHFENPWHKLMDIHLYAARPGHGRGFKRICSRIRRLHSTALRCPRRRSSNASWIGMARTDRRSRITCGRA